MKELLLSVVQLKKALSIRSRIDKLDAKISLLQKQLQGALGETDAAPKAKIRRKIKVRRKIKAKVQPTIVRVKKSRRGSLKALLVKVFQKSGKPLHIDAILNQLESIGYRTSSKRPKNQLNVRLYSDKDIVKTAPGTFYLKSLVSKATLAKPSK